MKNTPNTQQDWQQVSDIFLDEYWTDEVQGVAWDGQNWIFSCNAHQAKPGHNDKSIYVFAGGRPLGDDQWKSRIVYYQDVNHPIGGTDEGDSHWGQLCYHNGFLYVSHFWEGGPKQGQTNVVVFKDEDGYLQFYRWIELGQVATSNGRIFYPEFQAINPWNGKFYTCIGGDVVEEFFLHNPVTGQWEGETLSLSGFLPQRVQGACFSPDHRLYVAVDTRFSDLGEDYKWIFYYSAFDGSMLGKIPILAEEDGQELEGICYGNVSWPDGRTAQIHAVLLENHNVALDNIFFKSFSSVQTQAINNASETKPSTKDLTSNGLATNPQRFTDEEIRKLASMRKLDWEIEVMREQKVSGEQYVAISEDNLLKQG